MGYQDAAKTISDYFVPLAVSREQFVKIEKELGWEVKAGVTYAFHVVDHEGKRIATAMPDRVLGLDWDRPLRYGKDMQQFLDDVLAKAGGAKPRDIAKPSDRDIGLGLRADGSARLSVCVRQPSEYAKNGGNNWCKWPMFDTTVLTEEQLQTLWPDKVEVGAKYGIPVETAAEFAAVLTFDSTRACKLYAKDVTETRLSAEVTSVTEDAVEVRLTGMISGEGGAISVQGDGKLQGRLTFNRAGELQELLVLYEGEYQGGMIDRLINDNQGTPLEAIVTWRRNSDSG